MTDSPAMRSRLPFIVLVSLLAVAPSALAAGFDLTPDALTRPGPLSLDGGWRYRPGDDPSWADPALDDSSWEDVANPNLAADALPRSGWNGAAWFRLRVDVDPALAGVPVALEVWHRGASEVYVDGRLVARFGRPGASERDEEPLNPNYVPVSVVFAEGEHVLAIRYSSRSASDVTSGYGLWLVRSGRSLGVYARLDPGDVAAASAVREGVRQAAREYGQSGIIFAFGLIHLVLFAFYPRQRANLFYSLFTLSAATTVLLAYAINGFVGLDVSGTYVVGVAQAFALGLMMTSLVAFLAAAFWPRATWLAYVAGALWLVRAVCMATPALVLVGVWSFWPLVAVTVGAALFVIGRALVRGLDGARIVAGGVVGLFIIFARDYVQTIGVSLPGDSSFLVGVGALTCLLLAGSGFLARRFARTNRELEARLVEVETLSVQAIENERRTAALAAENERRAKELEEARQLQLSMLPKQVPDVANLDIATFMSTASEVGGDYYDFQLSDGTLTVVVGDATGHGLKAGTVVTATKSLFCAAGAPADIPATFREFTRTLKQMRLGRLYMALTIAKIEGSRMTLSAAGMPPALVYRAATGEVEEVLIKGMPLGAFVEFRYEQRELHLAPGDAVLFMSDGLPELFNPAREMFDYERTREAFRSAATGSASEIIDALCRRAEAWSDGRPQDDDITFVALKVR